MARHVVRQGECIESIAGVHGFDWQTLWDCPENASLRSTRTEPTILQAGDVVEIPDKRSKLETGATEQRHRFVRKSVPVVLRLRILRPNDEEHADAIPEPPDTEQLSVQYDDPAPAELPPDEPWRDAPYRLVVEGEILEGSTDGDGRLEQAIPSGARNGRLQMEPGTATEAVFELNLGGLDPIETPTGVADRLNNLGYAGGERSEQATRTLREAIRTFQRDRGLDVTGEVNDETRAQLEELHGS